MSLKDLVSLGLGGTIGSGIFVLSGFIARRYAGPATPLCFVISGVCAVLSGSCYAELSARIPVSGSAYAYVYTCIGEYFAVVAAACLTLEYMISGAAVARSWGDKVLEWLKVEMEAGSWAEATLEPFGSESFNPLAGLLSALTTYLLYTGVRESKRVTNVVTVAKVLVVIFITLGGFFLYNVDNVKPFVPPHSINPETKEEFIGGFAGVLRGATSSFFGYLGYDEVCCVAGEAINPSVNVPRAVMLTILGAATLYVFATTALTGMQPYPEISESSGFPDAFHYNGVTWAAQIAAVGEVLTLPLVVLVSLLAQPRVYFMMSVDGLLPKVFREIDYIGGGEEGNLTKGILICGVAMTAIAAFVPFSLLNDMISAGVLVSFSLTDTSLLLFRKSSASGKENQIEKLTAGINGVSFIGSLIFVRANNWFGWVTFVFTVTWVSWAAYTINKECPERKNKSGEENLFRTPFVPFLPVVAIFINWYLIAQLEMLGLGLLAVYMGLTTLLYFGYSIGHSVGNNEGWRKGKAGRERGNEVEEGDVELTEKDNVSLLERHG